MHVIRHFSVGRPDWHGKREPKDCRSQVCSPTQRKPLYVKDLASSRAYGSVRRVERFFFFFFQVQGKRCLPINQSSISELVL